MDKIIDYSKPIYLQASGSYDACIPPYQGYQVTRERDPELFAEIQAKITSGEVVAIPEPTPPEPSAEQKAAAARASIISQLQALEQKKLRPLGAIINGTSTDADKAKLADLETQIGALRAQLATIG